MRDSSVAGAASRVVRKSRVGARLVEDSSGAAAAAGSSGNSAFFLRELGPRTTARPRTQGRGQGRYRRHLASPQHSLPLRCRPGGQGPRGSLGSASIPWGAQRAGAGGFTMEGFLEEEMELERGAL